MESKQQDNPFTSIPDPFEEHNRSIDELAKANPGVNEFSRICYEIFMMNHDGKKLWEILEQRYLLSNLVNPMMPNVDVNANALYWVGFTDCIKMFKQLAMQHKQRIDAV